MGKSTIRMAILAQKWPNLARKIMDVGVESILVNYVSIFFNYISQISIGADCHCKRRLEVTFDDPVCAQEGIFNGKVNAILVRVQMNGLFCVLHIFFRFSKN